MSNYLIVTTFNKKGYELYGRRMLESFLAHWPMDQTILVYVEDVALDTNITADPRVIVRDLNTVRDLTTFKIRHDKDIKAHGGLAKDFKFDAVRFSHKVFALYDAVKNPLAEIKTIVWLDADTITHRKIPDDLLEQAAPRSFWKNGITEKYGISYLGRTKQYTECGFVSYNLMHPKMMAFWETFADMYRSDALFRLPEWHDSYIFDYVRQKYETSGMINHNITPGFYSGHPFINCILGDYMDHMKGARKKSGRSRKNERHIKGRDESDWWK